MPDEKQLDFDDRLTKVNPSQYRIWHDSQNILVPKGQSTTKPLTTEIVNVNTKVYGKVIKSFFNKPRVDFTNTNVKPERFDRYYLQIWRDASNLPIHNPIVDYHDDLGMNTLHAYVMINFHSDIFTGMYEGMTRFDYVEGKTWESEKLRFHNHALQELYGDFFLVTNPLPLHLSQGARYDFNLTLQDTNLPVSLILERSTIKNGNSEMRLQLQNNVEYPVTIGEFILVMKGGE